MTGDRMQLDGKVAVITGTARGIGRACAVQFAAQGARLVLLDVAAPISGVPYPLGSKSQLDHTQELCRAQGAATLAVIADVRDPNGIRDAIDLTIERFGRIDILVNNAGIAAPSGKAAHEIDEDEWQLMIDIDLSGAWRMLKATSPGMLARRSGSIINIASTAGMVGYRHFAGYVAAKHGVIGLTRAAALDFAPFKVRVNAICPGSVRDDAAVEGRMLSEIARSLSVPVEEHEQTFVQAQPMNALIEPEDVSATAVWLASDSSRQITGSVVAVDGGFTAR
jgi:NAD(P)-dependent dehydrogenase (short-subunit alcohol dehydrogenase family)